MTPSPSAVSSTPPIEPTITLHDELLFAFALDNNLLIPGRIQRRTTVLNAASAPVTEHVRPVLTFGTRVYVDEERAVRLCPPLGEPSFERRPGSVRLCRTRREVAVAGNEALVWTLLRLMDGDRTTATILTKVPVEHRAVVARLLAALAAAGVVDASGRPVGRFLHAATKRGSLPDGGLSWEALRELVTDGNYRAYPDAPRLPVTCDVPERLVPFHTLTRARRSYRDYNGTAVTRADFDALLTTACGVTGILEWTGREAKLRAYPSGGALYAIEIYPVVFAVEGLRPAVYHFHAIEGALELVQPDINRTLFLNAAVPAEREMIGGVAAIICLCGVFARFEYKYGQGGYRMMVAEAGHISQNLILAATALGLHARPWGGAFDTPMNRALGFDADSEQWLLSVIVGYADGRLPPTRRVP